MAWRLGNQFVCNEFCADALQTSVGCRHAPRLSRQAALSAEFVWTQDRNNGFPSLLGNDRDLDLAFLDMEHRIRRLALRENDFTLLVRDRVRSPSMVAGNTFGSNGGSFFTFFAMTDSLRRAP